MHSTWGRLSITSSDVGSAKGSRQVSGVNYKQLAMPHYPNNLRKFPTTPLRRHFPYSVNFPPTHFTMPHRLAGKQKIDLVDTAFHLNPSARAKTELDTFSDVWNLVFGSEVPIPAVKVDIPDFIPGLTEGWFC